VTKEYNLLQITFSKTLERIASMNIGLQSLGDFGEVILGMGVICAIFRRLGNLPFTIHLLKNSDDHEDKLLAEIFESFAGMS